MDASPHIQGQGLICYGDILANVDLAALQRGHRSTGALATLCGLPTAESRSWPKSLCCRIGSISDSCSANHALRLLQAHPGRLLTVNTEKQRMQAEKELTDFATGMDYQAI